MSARKKLTDEQIATIPQDLLDEVERMVVHDLATFYVSTYRHKKTKPVRIRYGGEWIVLPSGKTIWKRLGDAKSALRQAVDDNITTYDYSTGKMKMRESGRIIETYEKRRILSEYYLKKLLEAVEFVEVDES